MGDNEMYNEEYEGPERRTFPHECKQQITLGRIEFKLDSMDAKVDGMRGSLYGANGTAGVTGQLNWLKGGFAIICILLGTIAMLSYNGLTKMTEHTEQMYQLQADVQMLSVEFSQHSDELRMKEAHDKLHREKVNGEQ